jgi:hypothetical protein
MEESEDSTISEYTSDISSQSKTSEKENIKILYEFVDPEKRSFWICVLILRLYLPVRRFC